MTGRQRLCTWLICSQKYAALYFFYFLETDRAAGTHNFQKVHVNNRICTGFPLKFSGRIMSNYQQQRRQNRPINREPAVSGGMKIGIAILTFFIPLVGLIMGLIFINDSDPSKQDAGKLWLICVACYFGLSLFCACSYVMLVLTAASAGGI